MEKLHKAKPPRELKKMFSSHVTERLRQDFSYKSVPFDVDRMREALLATEKISHIQAARVSIKRKR